MDERLAKAKALEAEAAQIREEVKANPTKAVLTPYLIVDGPGKFRVGANDEPPVGDYPYFGPRAEIFADEMFVHVVTDDYEGHAMLNLEALPFFIEALVQLREHIAMSVLTRDWPERWR